MTITRRRFAQLGMGAAYCLSGEPLLEQGLSTHSAKPLPRSAHSGRPFHARLVDVAREAGLRAPVIYGGVEQTKYIVETTGCGCAFIDYDNDGWMDIFILSGTRIEGAPEGTTNRLYKNNRDGTFTDVTKEAGLWDHEQRWGAGCSFLDYDRDGHLDLFVSNYVRFSFEQAPVPGQNSSCLWLGIPVACGPRGLPTGRHWLYRNNSDGTFTDVSESAGIAQVTSSYGLTVAAADFDEDGWPDIYVACDATPSLLFMNNHDGTFREEGLLRGVALNDDGLAQAGMGVAVGDYDVDGHLDIFKTHFADDRNILYRNNGKAYFQDSTASSRLGVETRYVCWGAGIVDLGNDGYPDLFMTTGHVDPKIEKKLPQYPNKTPRAVFRNLGQGVFEELIGEAGPGVAAPHC